MPTSYSPSPQMSLPVASGEGSDPGHRQRRAASSSSVSVAVSDSSLAARWPATASVASLSLASQVPRAAVRAETGRRDDYAQPRQDGIQAHIFHGYQAQPHAVIAAARA